MIYTVTCNPSLDYIVSVEDFKLGMTNRTSREQMLPEERGSMYIIVLRNLGVESTAFGFLAGFVGAEIQKKNGGNWLCNGFHSFGRRKFPYQCKT